VEGLKSLLSNGSMTSVKKKQLVPLQIFQFLSENMIPLMQSGVVEGLKLLLSNGTVKGKETAACGHCKYFM